MYSHLAFKYCPSIFYITLHCSDICITTSYSLHRVHPHFSVPLFITLSFQIPKRNYANWIQKTTIYVQFPPTFHCQTRDFFSFLFCPLDHLWISLHLIFIILHIHISNPAVVSNQMLPNLVLVQFFSQAYCPTSILQVFCLPLVTAF